MRRRCTVWMDHEPSEAPSGHAQPGGAVLSAAPGEDIKQVPRRRNPHVDHRSLSPGERVSRLTARRVYCPLLLIEIGEMIDAKHFDRMSKHFYRLSQSFLTVPCSSPNSHVGSVYTFVARAPPPLTAARAHAETTPPRALVSPLLSLFVS